MKPKNLLTFLCLIITFNNAYCDTNSSSINIIPLGQYHGDEVPYPNGSSWYALTEENGQSKLERVELKIRWIYDAVLDGDEKGPYTGKIVKTEPITNAILLIQGDIFHEGVVKSAEITGEKIGLTKKNIRLESKKYTLSVNSGCSKDNNPCQWVLSDGIDKQVLQEFYITETEGNKLDTDSSNTGIIWAGDLDGDERLDIIVDVSDHYNTVANIRVFLSSHAKENKFFGEVGIFHAVGC